MVIRAEHVGTAVRGILVHPLDQAGANGTGAIADQEVVDHEAGERVVAIRGVGFRLETGTPA